MRFAIKKANSKAKDLDYFKNRAEIAEILKSEQQNFCAYTEKYLGETDAGDIEHFNDRLKNTLDDNYFNWYFVATWANRGKPKIINYQPIIQPEQAFDKNNGEINRIFYDKNTNKYETVLKPDVAAQNLIDFIDLNHQSLFFDRLNTIKMVKSLEKVLPNKAELENHLLENPTCLNFITALETHFGLRLLAQLQP